MALPPPGHGKMRVGDYERRAVVEQLQAALDAGRLSLAEFDERSTGAWNAATYRQLYPLLADLPGATMPPPSAPSESTDHERGGNDHLGTGAIVCGSVGLCVPCVAPIAIILGAVGMRTDRWGLALGGLILGIVGSGIWLTLLLTA